MAQQTTCNMDNITFQTSDKKLIKVDLKIAQRIGIIKLMLEGCGIDESTQSVVPLERVSSKIFRLALEWLEHHKDDTPTEQNITRPVDITPWDKQFMEMDKVIIFELINAANFLDIQELFKLGCKTVANMIKGKSTEAIRETFNITNDFTPEEEEKIRQQYAWCEKK